MTEKQFSALKEFIYWSCRNAVAEATENDQGERQRMNQAEEEFDAALRLTGDTA